MHVYTVPYFCKVLLLFSLLDLRWAVPSGSIKASMTMHHCVSIYNFIASHKITYLFTVNLYLCFSLCHIDLYPSKDPDPFSSFYINMKHLHVWSFIPVLLALYFLSTRSSTKMEPLQYSMNLSQTAGSAHIKMNQLNGSTLIPRQ